MPDFRTGQSRRGKPSRLGDVRRLRSGLPAGGVPLAQHLREAPGLAPAADRGAAVGPGRALRVLEPGDARGPGDFRRLGLLLPQLLGDAIALIVRPAGADDDLVVAPLRTGIA